MIKREVVFVDLFGEEVKEELYFHLNMQEFMSLEAKYGGDLVKFLGYVSSNEKKNYTVMIDFIKDIIETAYGEKTPDGRQFIKSQEVKDRFKASMAYAQFFEDLLFKEGAVKAFAEGLLVKPSKSANVNEDGRYMPPSNNQVN